jgi:hypothetical protein
MFARILVFVYVLISTSLAEAAMPPALTVEYSADRSIETDSGTIQGSIMAAPGMERGEMRMGAVSSVMIVRMDARKGWMLMPAQKMYQEMNFTQAAQQSGAVDPDRVELEAAGTETVSGIATTKYKFVAKDRKSGGFLWYSADGIPVKMDVLSKEGGKNSRMTVTLQNIRVGTQDRNAFEVPAGYNRLPGGGLFGMQR